MTIEEIKSWAKDNINDNNKKNAFILITIIIYEKTDDRLNDIEKFYEWFSEKWEDCRESVRQKYKAQHFHLMPGADILNLFYSTWINRQFNINENIKNAYCSVNNKGVEISFEEI